MSNSYFQFKQFRIVQEQCAMKVTTDACIQGAWTPVLPGVRRVLDIGAGTGLLSLMLAQKKPDIVIDAIELDTNAAAQARENVAASPWVHRINVQEGDIRNYIATTQYELIIVNPPFFNNSLLSEQASKNNARHTLSLSYSDLLKAIALNLQDEGYVSVLLPYTEYKLWKELAERSGFYESGKLSISHRDGAEIKRVVGVFSKRELPGITDATLLIKNNDQRYTADFISLLSPYYLDLPGT